MPTRLIAILFLLFASSVHSEDLDNAISTQMIETSLKLRQLAVDNPTGYQIVESLTTEVGARLAGSPAETRARDWAVEKLSSMGFEHVRIEEFKVPLWERGTESAQVTSPFPQSLSITALGGSVSTGPEGIEGEIITFASPTPGKCIVSVVTRLSTLYPQLHSQHRMPINLRALPVTVFLSSSI